MGEEWLVVENFHLRGGSICSKITCELEIIAKLLSVYNIDKNRSLAAQL